MAANGSCESSGSTSSSKSDNESTETASAPAKTGRWRPQDVIFAFGPNNDYFISTSLDSWRFWGGVRLSDSFETLRGGKPIVVTLTPDGGGLWVYENASGLLRANLCIANVQISSSEAEGWADRHKQYRRLMEFLEHAGGNSEVTTDVALSIGLGGRWFARCGNKVAHHGLPKDLDELIEDRQANGIYPRQLTLGADGDYAVLWSGGEGAHWSITGTNGCLKYLKSGEKLNTLVLSPYNANAFFIVTEHGEVLHSISGLPSGEIEEMCHLSKAFMQRTARTWHKTLIWDAVVDGKAERLSITPDTNYDKPAVDPLRRREQRLFSGSWYLQRLEQSLTDRSTLITTGTASAVSAVVVGATTAWTMRMRSNVTQGAVAPAASPVALTKMKRFPLKSAAVAAGLVAIGTAAINTWLARKTT